MAGVKVQHRDREIFRKIYEYGGVLAGYHLWQMFWPNAKDMQAVRKRLSKLYRQGFLQRPTVEHRQRYFIPKSSVYWLGWRGILDVAAQMGVEVDEPRTVNENQMRKLRNALRESGVHWLREPRWIPLRSHDLHVIDFRLAVENEIKHTPYFEVEEWIHEGAFRSDSDLINYEYPDQTGRMRRGRKRIWPDWYFAIIDLRRRERGEPFRARFLLEYETGSRDNPRFGREKVAPGLAYIKSPAYKARFGNNAGTWLIIAAGTTAMKRRMQQAERIAGNDAKLFYFTSLNALKAVRPLTSSIWWQVHASQPVALFPGRDV